MIQSCPSCGTLYRDPAPPTGAKGRCASCREVFPLVTLRPYRLVAVAADGGARVPAGAASARSHRRSMGVEEPILDVGFPGGSYDTDLPEPSPGPLRDGLSDEPSRDAPAVPRTAPARSREAGGVVSSTRGVPEAARGARDTSGFESMIEDVRSQAPSDWFRVAGWTVVGVGTGVAAQSALGGPVWLGAGAGVAAGWLAAWGHQRWTLRRS